MPAKIGIERIIEAVQADDGTGYCIDCGAEAYNVEPDASEYECETCGEHAVYGAEQLLIIGCC